jgi:hypothetical protein
MKTIKYLTGRNYGTDQMLVITAPAAPDTEEGYSDWVSVSFVDESRGIQGSVQLLGCELWSNNYRIGQAVLREYDAGRYTELVRSTVHEVITRLNVIVDAEVDGEELEQILMNALECHCSVLGMDASGNLIHTKF